MAFVRWRGNTAQVLASTWEDGRSKQVLICSLPPGERQITASIKAAVERDLPSIAVNWTSIQEALDAGPKGREYQEVARQLLAWSADAHPQYSKALRDAANVLWTWVSLDHSD